MNYPKPLRDTKWVFDQISSALQKNKGFALVRVGDGETLTIAHNDLVDFSQIPTWLKNGYAGVHLPDKKVRLDLLSAIRQAHVLGVPLEEWPHFKFLMLRIMSHYKFIPENICSSRVNFSLYRSKMLESLIKDRDIIVVGRKAKESALYFRKLTRSSKFYDLSDITHLDTTFQLIKKDLNFSIAIVAAGIPAKILCVRLSKLGKVALDMGHVLDNIVDPKALDVLKIMSQWQIKKN